MDYVKSRRKKFGDGPAKEIGQIPALTVYGKD
jgi:hypothetical protein